MTLTLNTVTGNIFIPAGYAQPGATVQFTLSHVDFEYDTIVPYVVTATIATDGSFSAPMWANVTGLMGSWYDVYYEYLRPVTGLVVRKSLGRIQVPATGVADLDFLLNLPINDPAYQYAYFSQAEWDALVDQSSRSVQFPAPYPGIPLVTGSNRLLGTDNSGLLTEYAVTDIGGIPVVQPNPYETRAEFLAATLDAVPPLRVDVAGLKYVQDASGTALPHPSGVKYSPDGLPTPEHFGAVGDGVTDDKVALNALMAYCAANDHITENGTCSGTYATSDIIYFPSGSSQFTLNGLSMRALIGFPASSPILHISSAYTNIINCVFFCDDNSDGVYVNNVRACNFYGNRFWAPKENGIYSAYNTQDARYTNNYFQASTAGATRTATGINILSADCEISGNKFQWMKRGIYCPYGGVQIIGNHIYQGGGVGADETVPAISRADGVAIETFGRNVIITGNYIDKCYIKVTGGTIDRTGLLISNNLFYTQAAYAGVDAFILCTAGRTLVFYDQIIKDNTTFNASGFSSAPNLKLIMYTDESGVEDVAQVLSYPSRCHISGNTGNVAYNNPVIQGDVTVGHSLHVKGDELVEGDFRVYGQTKLGLVSGLELGPNGATGGGPVAIIDDTGGTFNLQFSDGAGGVVASKAMTWDIAKQALTVRGLVIETGSPAATDPGATHELRASGNYLYLCVASGDWRRALFTTY